MPTYAFRCRMCRAPMELTMHIPEYEKAKQGGAECPNCHGKELDVEIGPFEVKTVRKT